MTTPIISPNARADSSEQSTSQVAAAPRKTLPLGRLQLPLVALAILVTGLAGLLTSSTLVTNDPGAPGNATTGESESSPSQPAGIDFSHHKHVPDSWLFGQDEVQRDCRGCHDFSAEEPSDWPAPTAACTSCHGFGSFEISGSPESNPARAFPEHGKHAGLQCSVCHVISDELEEIPKFMPIPVRDSGYCVRCHAQRSGSMGDRKTEDANRAAKFAKRDTERGNVPPRFLHSQHLSSDQMADADSCQRCHTNIASSDAGNLGEKQFNPKSCSECHTAEFEVETYLRPSKTAAAFWHEYHLGSKAMRVEEKLAGQRCAACHVYDDKLQNYRLQDFFPAQGDTHDGCVTCHEHQEWKVERHGQTDECAQCHAIQGGSLSQLAGMATNRPRKRLLRPRPLGFKFGAHSHPLITGENGKALDENCSECHRAEVAELPSMLTSRPFDHSSHLSGDIGDISAADCQKCHSEIGGEAFNRLKDQLAMVDQPDAEPTLIYEDESCGACHGGEFETVFPEDRTREVMWFSHSEHLQRRHPETNKRFDCLHCHVEGTSGDAFEVRVPEEVRNCTQCHGHEKHAETTAGFTLDEVGSCVECHRSSPIPERGVPVQVERLRIAAKIGVETHDRGGECKSCHQMAPLDATEAVGQRDAPTSRAISAERKFYIHKNEYPEWDAKNRFFNRDGPEDQWCVDCHWQSQTHQFRRDSEFKNEPYYEKGLTATKLRKKVGNNLTGFPGFAE